MAAASNPIAIDGLTVRGVLPHGYPFLMLDAVERYVPEERLLVGVKLVSQNEPFMQGHFPEYPILPGVIIIEALAQACGMLMNLEELLERGVPRGELVEALRHMKASEAVLAESRVKHMAGVYAGDRMELEVQLIQKREGLHVFKVGASVRSNPVAKGQLTLAQGRGESATHAAR